MRRSQIAGALLVVVGLVVLFFLRQSLVELIFEVLKLIGIFLGFALLLAGIALLVGGRIRGRRSWSMGETST